MSRKATAGCIKVHNKDIIDVFVTDGENERTKLDLKKSRRNIKKSDARTSSAPDLATGCSVGSKGQHSQSIRVQDWLNEKTIKELQERADREGQAAKRLYTPFLETEATFIKDVGDFLAHKELIDLRKKEVLHKRWSDQVFEPIRRKILEAIDGSEWQNLDRRKREMHQQYLEHINKKGQAFLDDDDNQEYYAQALNGHRPAPLKIRTESLCDPLLTQSRQRSEEDRTIMRCMTGQRYTDKDLEQVRLPPLSLTPLGRHGISSSKWLEVPLHNVESTPREMSRRRMLGNCTKNSINFSVWNNSGCDPKIVEQELQIPRRRIFAEQPPYGKPLSKIPETPFIDPDDFSDKIINTNPFQEHMQNVIREANEKKAFYDQQQELMLEEEQFQQPMLVEA